jgi:hypothetical protein
MTLQALGGDEFALRLIPRQKDAPLYWRSDTQTHSHSHILCQSDTSCVKTHTFYLRVDYMYITWDHINTNCIFFSVCFACTLYSLVLI